MPIIKPTKFFHGEAPEVDWVPTDPKTAVTFNHDVIRVGADGTQTQLVAANVPVHPDFAAAIKSDLKGEADPDWAEAQTEKKAAKPETETKSATPATENKAAKK